MNSFKLIISPFAEQDLTQIKEWYQLFSERSSFNFVEELDELFHFIKNNPYQFPIIHKDIRKAVLHRYPYSIYYKLTDNVIVLAVIHHKRSPKVVRKRIS